MEWEAHEAPQTPGENTVTLQAPFIPGEAVEVGEEGIQESTPAHTGELVVNTTDNVDDTNDTATHVIVKVVNVDVDDGVASKVQEDSIKTVNVIDDGAVAAASADQEEKVLKAVDGEGASAVHKKTSEANVVSDGRSIITDDEDTKKPIGAADSSAVQAMSITPIVDAGDRRSASAGMAVAIGCKVEGVPKPVSNKLSGGAGMGSKVGGGTTGDGAGRGSGSVQNFSPVLSQTAGAGKQTPRALARAAASAATGGVGGGGGTTRPRVESPAKMSTKRAKKGTAAGGGEVAGNSPSPLSVLGSPVQPGSEKSAMTVAAPKSVTPKRNVAGSAVTYAVQCGQCHKWRRVSYVEEYEKIRARGPTDSPWVCGESVAWKKNAGGTDACSEPAELEPDGRLTWALDKPHIPRTPTGWRRRVAVRGGSAKKFADVYYYTPCNKQLRSIVEVERFLFENPSYKEKYSLSKDNFSFAAPRAYPTGSPMLSPSSKTKTGATDISVFVHPRTPVSVARDGDGANMAPTDVDGRGAAPDSDRVSNDKDRSNSGKIHTAMPAGSGPVVRNGKATGIGNGSAEVPHGDVLTNPIFIEDRAFNTPVRAGTARGSAETPSESLPVVAHRTPLFSPSIANNALAAVPSTNQGKTGHGHPDVLSPSVQFNAFATPLQDLPDDAAVVLSDLPAIVAPPELADDLPVTEVPATALCDIDEDLNGRPGLDLEMVNGEGGGAEEGDEGALEEGNGEVPVAEEEMRQEDEDDGHSLNEEVSVMEGQE